MGGNTINASSSNSEKTSEDALTPRIEKQVSEDRKEIAQILEWEDIIIKIALNFYNILWAGWNILDVFSWKIYINPKKWGSIYSWNTGFVLKYLWINWDLYTKLELDEISIKMMVYLLKNAITTQNIYHHNENTSNPEAKFKYTTEIMLEELDKVFEDK